MQQFGGNWTEEKLSRIKKYLAAYQQVMKNKRFYTIYIDAFAGTGQREAKPECKDELSSFFSLLEKEDNSGIREGSAIEALKIIPNFDQYVFIEKMPEKCYELQEKVLKDFPEMEDKIQFVNGDANEVIIDLCDKLKTFDRAVLFLDPFGMQVEWNTIKKVAETKKIDMWYLFPCGIGANRLMPRDGEFPPGFEHRLDLVFGTRDWKERFYQKRKTKTLFEDEPEGLRKIASFENIRDYFLERLREIFAGVADESLPLSNSRQSQMYLLCFACGNEKGKTIALKIANHILKNK